MIGTHLDPLGFALGSGLAQGAMALGADHHRQQGWQSMLHAIAPMMDPQGFGQAGGAIGPATDPTANIAPFLGIRDRQLQEMAMKMLGGNIMSPMERLAMQIKNEQQAHNQQMFPLKERKAAADADIAEHNRELRGADVDNIELDRMKKIADLARTTEGPMTDYDKLMRDLNPDVLKTKTPAQQRAILHKAGLGVKDKDLNEQLSFWQQLFANTWKKGVMGQILDEVQPGQETVHNHARQKMKDIIKQMEGDMYTLVQDPEGGLNKIMFRNLEQYLFDPQHAGSRPLYDTPGPGVVGR